MDDCLCASIGSVAVSAALEMRGWLALRVEVSNWVSRDGFVAGNLLPSGALLAGIPFFFPVWCSYRGWRKHAFSFTFDECGGNFLADD